MANEQIVYADCPDCGDGRDIVTVANPSLFDASGVRSMTEPAIIPTCVGCGERVVPATVKIDGRLVNRRGTRPVFRRIELVDRSSKRKSSARVPACGAKCLTGQVTCDCPCRGRCHGANTCQC